MEVNGRIQTGSYTNQDGQKIYTTDVVVEAAGFAESKAAQQDNGIPAPQETDDGFMRIGKNHQLVRRCGSALLGLEVLADGFAQHSMTEIFLSA